MIPDVATIIERARLTAQSSSAETAKAPDAQREQLKRIAAEFESMLLVQVLKDMRKAGSWDEEGGGDTLGAESLFETLDVELASHLARVKGMGLGTQLEEAFDRLHPSTSGTSVLPVQTAETRSPGVVAGQAAASPRLRESANANGGGNPLGSALKAVGEAAVAGPKAVAGLVRPVAGAVTSAFGWRNHPITGQQKFHQGVDLRAAYGQDVHAAAAGRVVFSGEQGGYGTTVVIQHQDGTKTRYAHLSARLVEKGEQIGAGEPLGRAGRSGRATGTHLHFEVIAADGRRIQPDRWIAGNPAGVAVDRPVKDHGPDAD